MSKARVVRRAQRYEFTRENAMLRLSALALMRQLVGMTSVLPRHHREQISLGLWKWTEAPGQPAHAKYNLRFISKGVMDAEAETRVNHEHVFPRKWLVQRLLELDPDSSDFETFLDAHGAACVVTVEEHADLGAVSGHGWMRYVNAGVAVYDREKEQYVDPATLMPVGFGVTDDPEDPETVPDVVEATAATEKRDVFDLIRRHCDSSRAPLLRRLARSATLALGVPMPQRSDNPAYFRVHDTVVEEPTRAAAFVNYNGRVDLGLVYDELREEVRNLEWVTPVTGRHPYRVRCMVTDEQSMETAEELLAMALGRIRDQHAA